MQLRLKELRLEKGITQQVIADAIGCSTGAYSKYETGQRDPSIVILNRIADYYGVSVDYILGREVDSSSALTNDEIALINKLRASDSFVKESTLDIVELLDNKYRAFSGRLNSKE